MNAKEFFNYEIKDNSFNGYSLNTISNLNIDFYCDTYRKHSSHLAIRKNGIVNYVNELYRNLADKKLSELNISQITFDDEFEANQEQKIFEITGYNFETLKIHTGNIVGSIVYKSHNFNINCRFGNDFLQYMIANTSGFLELENLGSINENIGLGEWILVYYWKLQLKMAFSLGMYKTYRKKQENLTAIRGSININSFLKKNYFDGKTVCEFREHSFDNELNAVINMALTKVFRSKYFPIVSNIYSIKNAFDALNLKKRNLKSIKNNKVINPYFKKYNRVFDLSLKILNDEFANVGNSKSDFSAFLFDISLLFEHHIRKILKQKHTLFPKNKKEFSIPNGIYENSIYPDIIIDYGNNNIGIYDVKYKRFDFVNGVNREDRFQIITYIATHLKKYNVIDSGIIYPLKESEFENVVKVKKQTIKISKNEIPFQVRFYKVSNNLKKQIKIDKEFIKNFPTSPLTQ
ncbi:5-methylcytosine restriction system specificity protein McrC [Lutibacter sp.]